MEHKPSYEEMAGRLAELEETHRALQNQEVDAIVTTRDVLLLRLKKVEDERNKIEEALRETQKDLNRAQAVAQTGSWRLDVQRNVLLWSDENHRIFGILEGTIMTYETFLSCVHPDDRQYVDSKWNAALQGEDYDIEHRIIVGDEVKWVRERAELDFDEQGMLKGGFGTTQDITDHKKVEEQLVYQARLLDTIEDCILAAGVDRRITYWGKGSTNLLGWQSEEVMGRDSLYVFLLEESRSKVEAIEKFIRSGESWAGEIAVRCRDGALVPLLAQVSPVLNQEGRLIGVVAVGKDITERKKIEQIKDEFIGLVSHELRTPLTIITGSLKTALSQGMSPQDVLELVQNAAEGTDSLAAILENMLELSRYQAGRLKFNVVPVDIGDIARYVFAKLKGQGAKQCFTLVFPDDLPPVQADATRVERILYNLLENATKYSPEKSEIRVSCRKEEGFIITEVTDQGEGISPGDQARLFELFEQLHEERRTTRGLGLGLVVCKRLVEAQGGWIKVDSEVVRGSTFSFALPIRGPQT